MVNRIYSKENIFGDNIANMERWDFSRANMADADRVHAITLVASICYNNPKAVDSKSLYNRLASESKGLPSSSFEFIPVYLNEDDINMLLDETNMSLEILNIVKYGMWIEDSTQLLTNYRAILYDVEAGRLSEYWLTRFNTEKECDIIKKYNYTFLFNIDFVTRTQMLRHRVQWQELCIAGDSLIHTSQGNRSIEQMYTIQEKYKNTKGRGYKHPNVKIYDFNKKMFVMGPVKEIFKTGEKEVFEVIIQYGTSGKTYKIETSKEHKFLTKSGWKRLEDLKTKDFVAINGQPLWRSYEWCKQTKQIKEKRTTIRYGMIISIESKGIKPTYDLEVKHIDHNYVANGIVVHNSRRYVSGKKLPFTYYVSEKMKPIISKMKWNITSEAVATTEVDNCQAGVFTSDEVEISFTTQQVLDVCENHYYTALENGVLPQEARRIIPQAGYSNLWMSINRDQLDNYLKLRLDSTAQWEIRQTAIAIKESMKGDRDE